jgi:hypothetical protein
MYNIIRVKFNNYTHLKYYICLKIIKLSYNKINKYIYKNDYYIKKNLDNSI